MFSKLFSLVLLLLFSVASFAQTSKRKLPKIINMPTSNHTVPSVSGDGNTMVYLSDYSDKRRYALMFTYKTGNHQWAKPVILKVVDKMFELNYIEGFSLNYEGNKLFFTSRKSGGIGYYDIWVSERKGNAWSPIKNIGKPVNSATNEGSPSVAPNGKQLYFMRCETMAREKADKCQIFVADKKGNTWAAAVALPKIINNGANQMMPRILADGKTQLFRSDRDGEMKFYHSKNENGEWTTPKVLDFIPTETRVLGNTAREDVLYFGMNTSFKKVLVMAKIPEEFQPEKVVQVSGLVHDGSQNPLDKSVIKVFDTKDNSLFYAAYPHSKDGKFYLLLPQGKIYDFAITAKKMTHYSHLFDLSNLEKFRREKLDAKLEPLQSEAVIMADAIHFKPYSSEITEASTLEIRRVFTMLKKNPATNIEIGVHLDEILKDSLQSSPDLTEVIIDTVYLENDSLNIADITSSQSDSITSPNNISATDSLETNDNENKISSDNSEENETPSFRLKYTYHNDRSQKQAEAVMNFLISKGIAASRLTAKGYGDLVHSFPSNAQGQHTDHQRVEIKIE